MRKLDRDSLPHMVNCLGRLANGQWHTLNDRLAAHWWGVRLGARSQFYGRVRFRRHPGSRISIGDDCCFRSSTHRSCLLQTRDEAAAITIGPGCGFSGTFIACLTRVELGKNVLCGADTTIWDTDFHPEDPRSGPDAPVIIGDNVWLGANVMVLKGVTIGENTLVGAGSLVIRPLPPGVIAVGVPARAVREIDAGDLEKLRNHR